MKNDLIAKILFWFSIILIAFGYGLLSHRHNLFPVPLIQHAKDGGKELLDLLSGKLPWHYIKTNQKNRVIIHEPKAITPGLTLVSGVAADDELFAKIVNVQGEVVHSWKLDWFNIWPDPTHLPESDIPKSKPVADIHGIIVMSNGDIVFNFEYLGLVRLNVCGEVVWRVPYRTHHSLHLDEDGSFWVPGLVKRNERIENLPNHKPTFWDYSILQVSQDGQVIRDISVFDLLIENGLHGLLYMSTLNNGMTEVTYDTMHLNDIETFPSSIPEGVFERGDVMISLRNINAVIVFNLNDQKIKFITIGKVLRQHDPDFIDGNTISIYDNNNFFPDNRGRYSRIASISALDGSIVENFTGSKDFQFFSNIGGKHQLLPNGNILISEYAKGRAFEINASGTVIWEYYNIVEEGILGKLTDAQRLPKELDENFFSNASDMCFVKN
jgi:hypothetical protein